MSQSNGPNFSDADLRRLQARAPRAGYWLGIHPTHPFIHGPAIDPVAAVNEAQFPSVLPPPYTPPSAPPASLPGVAMPPAPSSTQAPIHGSLERFNVSVPVGTDVVGGTISTTSLRLEFGLPFGDFFSRVCAKMELDPLQALIGYKFSDDRMKDHARRLTNDGEFQDALAKVRDKMRRARTKEVIMVIHNLKSPTTTAAAVSTTKSTPNSKRKRETEDNAVEASDPSLKPVLRRLKDERACQTHTGRYCFVNPTLDKDGVGRHVPLNLFDLTLWAKKIQLNEATYTTPPNTIGFDPAFKKARREPQSTTVPSPPPVHVHLGGIHVNGAASETDRSPLRSSSRANAAAPLDIVDAEDDELIQYPSIDVLLADLHQVMPALNFPQYAGALLTNGVAYVDVVGNQAKSFYSDVIGMPPAILDNFLSHSKRLVRQAKKGKGKM